MCGTPLSSTSTSTGSDGTWDESFSSVPQPSVETTVVATSHRQTRTDLRTARAYRYAGGNASPAIGSRDRERERAANPGLALGPDSATMRFDDPLRNREAKACAFVPGTLAPEVALENPWQLLRIDARPAVAHPENHFVVSVLGADRD